MTGRIIGALTVEAGHPRLTIELVGNFRAFAESRLDHLSGKLLDIRMEPHREKRSLDANAYCWVLVSKLADALNVSTDEIYRQAIREIGGVSEIVCAQSEAVEQLRRVWESNGIGWQTDTMPSKIPGCTNVVLYYGSSVYNTKQMSNLISHLIDECAELGIETMPPDKLAALLGEWGTI